MPQKVNHSELRERIRVCYESDLPIFVYGPPGIGKSETIEELAKEKAEEQGKQFVKWEDVIEGTTSIDGGVYKEDLYENPDEYFILIDERLAQNDPTNIKGIPDTEGEVTKWHPPEWIDYCSQDGASGFIFCDELTHAPRMVQKGYFSLIDDRKVDDTRISDDVYIIAAGNREEDNAGVVPMLSTLNNRFGHVELKPPKGGREGNWTEWALENDVHESVVSFLSSRVGSSYLFNFNDDTKDSKAFATPRTWEMASDGIKASNAETPEEIANIAELFVGGVASDFKGFLEIRESLDIDKYLANPELVEEELSQDNQDVNIKHALVTGIAQEYKVNPESLDSVIEIAANLDTEFGTFLLSLLRQYNEEHWKENAPKNETFNNLSQEYYKYLN